MVIEHVHYDFSTSKFIETCIRVQYVAYVMIILSQLKRMCILLLLGILFYDKEKVFYKHHWVTTVS